MIGQLGQLGQTISKIGKRDVTFIREMRVGTWGPQKGDLRQGGVDILILAKEMSIFNAP